MRPLTTCLVLVLLFIAPGSLTHAQGTEPADKATASISAGATGATKDEVQQLRSEVAEQQKTIEELKVMVQRLVNSSPQASNAGSLQVDGNGARLVNANLVEPVESAQAKPADKPADKKPAEKKPEIPVVAGWSGEHFFIKSTDGKFQIQPYGYFQSDYRAYSGDGASSNTFLIRRARFGFQGNVGTHYDYAILIDAAATNGISFRDL
jgi:hypothetical protein